VWRYNLPTDLTAKLISYDNPMGTITNSDLELLATVIHKDVLAHEFDIRK
jgi:hypothetical protein